MGTLLETIHSYIACLLVRSHCMSAMSFSSDTNGCVFELAPVDFIWLGFQDNVGQSLTSLPC